MIIMSVSRISTASTQPRKYPARAPTTTPIRPAMRPMTSMMVMDCWAPRMVMAKRSRPIRSWPKGCSPQTNGQNEAVGAPSLTSGATSSWVYFHQPGIPQ